MQLEIFIIAFGVFLYVGSAIRITQESERFAIIAAGRYTGLRGPGLVFRWPGSGALWTRLRLGEEGRFLGDGLAQFGEVAIPVRMEEGVEQNGEIRISSFRGEEVWVKKP